MPEETHIAHRDLTPKVRGDSWRGIGSIRIRVKATQESTPVAPAIPVASAILQFRAKPDDTEAALTLSSADGGVVIVDADEWEFTVPPINDFPLDSWKWVWDFQTTNTAGFKRTYLKGTLNITRDVSRP